ncbi:histidine kinase [Marinitoga piezophila KA3]|uniref:histidine kinase n=1 Tax=Marinitoga piezophila (strain DSM 14283 / JCM 11233 / KA3) TaxID=443254 RepID=H2J4I2_MARPK|nr:MULTISPECIES: ATP-binding protein [Marinitoga]AEX84837.1 histidine kinase [Marinitoga piezophila KA3]APT75346.1 histidine kinase [Marinitoga sp. 1137]NUU97029.1 histidine kinase [Marinitoga sp. 1138]
MDTKILDFIEEAYIELDKIKVKEINKSAMDFGFKKGIELINIITFNEIDEFIKAIINNEDFEIETTVYFFQGESKYCFLKYLSNYNVLIIKDQTEKELVKKVKSDFITSLSHEIRTPLSVAKGNIYLAMDILNDNEAIKPLKKVRDSINKIERILDQLTLLSLAEFENYVLKFEIFDPQKIFEDVKNDLEEKIKRKNVSIDLDLNVEMLKGDPFVIYTILRNLISNAVKYSYENSRVYVSIFEDKIIVKDEGIGIRDEEKERVFERFYRGVDAKKYARGSGLGLAIVKYLCNLAGYKIEYNSQWMVGSTFIIHLNTDM